MGNPSFQDKVREFIGSIGWKLYIHAVWRGNEDKYFDSFIASEIAAGRIKANSPT